MKTVQLLYSYLLVDKPFSLESQPSAPTKEKRFAYNLYLDTILLIDRLAGQIRGKNKSLPLADSRFVVRTEGDDRIKSLRNKYYAAPFPFESIEPGLAEKIKESLLFREFEKNRDQGFAPDKFWENVYLNIIQVDEAYNSVVKSLPDYSLSGVERMKGMMDQTFKNFYATQDNVDDALKTLEYSLDKARDLYVRLLDLPVELTLLRLNQLEQNRKKYLAGQEDLNPNMKFVDNPIPRLIEQSGLFEEYVEKNHLSWKVEDPELLDILLKNVIESDLYREYIDSEETGLKKDSEFWQSTLTDIILNNPHFLEYLENKSVFWNDDLEIMTTFVVKTLKKLGTGENPDQAFLPKFKDERDARFGSELVRFVIRNKEVYQRYIDDALRHEKWETERLAFMDVVIIMTALAEIINYPEIPVEVSINEYIEIAKSYSSAKSGQFVHGLLASLITRLREEKIIIK
ncbi:MAG: transcription antitermination protein NusB [Muribaculaceae bacterium]|nr:transcription antitermination protein NusB [Muribaculaceae bacterium]